MTAPPPAKLLRHVMRHAGWVAAAVLLLALALGLARVVDDVEEEVDAAASLALAVAELGRLGAHGGQGSGAHQGTDDAGMSALDNLLRLQQSRPFRHLQLRVTDRSGRLLLPSPPVDQGEGWLAWLRWMGGEPGWPASGRDSPPPVSWTVPRPSGNVWTVTLTADAKSERLEALASLMESLALLAAMVGGLLWALRARLGRALAPLNQLVAAIGGIERSDTAQVQALPPMPVAELDAVAGALRHLGCALDLAESERRQLAQQVLSLQEDERARLARELHDELGQRLTALRVDAAWLAKRLATADGQQETQAVARSMADACGALQQDIRAVLAQLQPFADGAVQGATTPVPLSRLQELLCSLAEGWSARGREQSVVAVLVWRPDDQGQDDGWVEWPPGLLIDARLALAMYRISQEALTNVARHADARSVRLCVRLRGEAVPGGALHVEWAVEDDGAGIPDLAQACRRGSGLANLRERVWALGGELTAEAVRPGAPRPGCRLASSLNTRWASDAMPPP